MSAATTQIGKYPMTDGPASRTPSEPSESMKPEMRVVPPFW